MPGWHNLKFNIGGKTMESRTVKEILNDLSSLLGGIADLKDGEKLSHQN